MRTWGKHFLIEFGGFSVRIHFLMFGRWCINERKDIEPRLSLAFSRKRELNFYNCAVRYIEGDLDDEYDWRTDVMSDAWDAAAARRKLRRMPDELICDALLDQNVFAGVGNIIKNEVLFRVGVHPLIEGRRIACSNVAGPGRAGASVQLRVPGMEEGFRAEAALAGAQQGHLPSMQRTFDEGVSGQRGTGAPSFASAARSAFADRRLRVALCLRVDSLCATLRQECSALSSSGETRMSSHSFGGAPLVLVALLAVSSTANAAPSATRVRAVFPMENAAWHRGPPGFAGGSMFAVVSGDPVQAGPFMIRVELPSGYRLPPYRRPHDENIVVLAGAIEVGTRTLPAGSFVRLRANEWRSLSTQSGATLQIFGDGPFELK